MIGGPVLLTVGMGLLSTLRVDTLFGQWFGYQIVAGAVLGFNLYVQYLILY